VDVIIDDSSQSDDINEHRQVLNRLRRTDSDERMFLTSATDNLHGPDWPAKPGEKATTSTTSATTIIVLDDDSQKTQVFESPPSSPVCDDFRPSILCNDREQELAEANRAMIQRESDSNRNSITWNYPDGRKITASMPCDWSKPTTTTTTTTSHPIMEHNTSSDCLQSNRQYPLSQQEIEEFYNPHDDDDESAPKRTDEVRPVTIMPSIQEEPQGSEPLHTNGKKKFFQLRHNSIFLTYPQYEKADLQGVVDALHFLVKKWQPTSIVVAKESHHETEGEHLHALIECEKPINTRKQDYFDIFMHHPHIEVPRSIERTRQYVIKDGCWIAWPDNASFLKLLDAREKKKATKSDLIAREIMKETELDELRDRYPGFFMMHLPKIVEFKANFELGKEAKEGSLRFKSVTRFEGNGVLNNQRIAGWLNDHLLQPHKFRGQQLWLHGKTKIGKTSLVENLIQLGTNVLNVDYSSRFYNGINSHTQLLVFDEYKGQKTITEMNKLTDGSHAQVDVKGLSTGFQFKKPMPVLVLSNFSIAEAYHNSDQAHLETLSGRFIEINVTDFIVVNAIELLE